MSREQAEAGQQPQSGLSAQLRRVRPRRGGSRLRLLAVLAIVLPLWALAVARALNPPLLLPLWRPTQVRMSLIPSEEVRDPVSGERVLLEAFWIDRTEVTEAEWAEYLSAHPERPAPSHWEGAREPAPENLDLPVVNIAAPDASAYAAWRGQRLPCVAEWELAVRAGRAYPWGSGWAQHANTLEVGLGHRTPVALFEQGRSSFGLYDGLGNVREWTSDLVPEFYDRRHFVMGRSFRTPGRAARGLSAVLSPDRSLRSVSFVYPLTGGALRHRADDLGFRCAVSDEKLRAASERLDRIAELASQLGAQDPFGRWWTSSAAEERLLEIGPPALPALRYVRGAAAEGPVARRLDQLILAVSRQPADSTFSAALELFR